MEWTFGIITGGGQEVNINKIIDSIENQNIENNKYEILIIGNCNIERNNTIIIPFDENIKPNWITKKKNLISKLCKFENVVYLHDYVSFEPNWYFNFVNFGEDWDVCMNCIKNDDGRRFRDWTLWEPIPLNYNDHTQTKNMYVSGTYFCAKKQFMLKYPLDEKLGWNNCEDLVWSFMIRDFWNYKCNAKSIVKCLKHKEDHTFCTHPTEYKE